MIYFENIFVLQHTDQATTGWKILNKITVENTHLRNQNNCMIEKGCKTKNYNFEYKYKKYNIVHDTLKINFFTLTFPPKEEYYDASENSTKRATR